VKVLVDMNLSPIWVGFLTDRGIEAVHWMDVGDARAPDETLMRWARQRGAVGLTHDLDFSALVATTGASGPSVVQVRAQNVLPDAIGEDIVSVLREHSDALAEGAIVTVDEVASRVRILPVRK